MSEMVGADLKLEAVLRMLLEQIGSMASTEVNWHTFVFEKGHAMTPALAASFISFRQHTRESNPSGSY